MSTVGAKGGKAAAVTAGDVDRQTEVSHVKPTERELEKILKNDKRDWGVPLYPSGRGFRHHLGSKNVEREELAQMWYGEKMTDEVQLRDSSAEACQLQQLKVFEFKERCPIETQSMPTTALNSTLQFGSQWSCKSV